jgi:hypothetical protein
MMSLVEFKQWWQSWPGDDDKELRVAMQDVREEGPLAASLVRDKFFLGVASYQSTECLPTGLDMSFGSAYRWSPYSGTQTPDQVHK